MLLSRPLIRRCFVRPRATPANIFFFFKSTLADVQDEANAYSSTYGLNATAGDNSSSAAGAKEAIQFPEATPVVLDSKEHVVGYLSKILNARVYDAAIETELQEAKNLSHVRYNDVPDDDLKNPSHSHNNRNSTTMYY